MNCKNCEYGLKQRCGDFEKIICTYEEGECVKITELKKQIEKMKQELDTAREEANRQEQWELYSVLNGIYNDNFEVTTSVSN